MNDNDICRIGWGVFVSRTLAAREMASKRRNDMDALMERTFSSVKVSLAKTGMDGPLERAIGSIAMLHLYIVEQNSRIENLENVVAKLLTAQGRNK